MMWIYRF